MAQHFIVRAILDTVRAIAEEIGASIPFMSARTFRGIRRSESLHEINADHGRRTLVASPSLSSSMIVYHPEIAPPEG